MNSEKSMKKILNSKEELYEVILKLCKENINFSWKTDILSKYIIEGIRDYSGLFSNTSFQSIDLCGMRTDGIKGLDAMLQGVKHRARLVFDNGIESKLGDLSDFTTSADVENMLSQISKMEKGLAL